LPAITSWTPLSHHDAAMPELPFFFLASCTPPLLSKKGRLQ
jgi:hypothetical protein